MIEENIINELKLIDKIPLFINNSQRRFLEETLEKESGIEGFLVMSSTTFNNEDLDIIIGCNLKKSKENNNHLRNRTLNDFPKKLSFLKHKDSEVLNYYMYLKNKKTGEVKSKGFKPVSSQLLYFPITILPFFSKKIKGRVNKTLKVHDKIWFHMLTNYNKSKQVEFPCSNYSTFKPQKPYKIIKAENYGITRTQLIKLAVISEADEILNFNFHPGGFFTPSCYSGTFIQYIN